MKKFLKRVNRGIALGILFALGVVIYVIAGNMRFAKEKDLIKSSLNDYMDGFYETMEKTPDKVGEYIGKSWASKEVSNEIWLTDVVQMKEYMKSCKDNKSKITCDDTKIKSISIKRYGDKGAYVSINASAKYKIMKTSDKSIIFDAELMTPFGITHLYNEFGKDETDNDGFDGVEANVQYEGSIYMYREDGQWKISQTDAYAYIDRIGMLKGDEN